MNSASDFKKKNVRKRDEYWDVQPVRCCFSFQFATKLLMRNKWMKPPKETRRVACNFPDPDLLSSLISLYFTYKDNFMPLLHRPTFERAIADQLHHRDVQFAAMVLLVCAIGAGYSEDPRVTAIPHDHPQSLSWTWFHQSQALHPKVLYRPSLYVIQAHCVSFLLSQASNLISF